MKKYYTATATMKDDTHEWKITIYSLYESEEEAKRGVERFKARYGNAVLSTTIEPRI